MILREPTLQNLPPKRTNQLRISFLTPSQLARDVRDPVSVMLRLGARKDRLPMNLEASSPDPDMACARFFQMYHLGTQRKKDKEGREVGPVMLFD